LTGRKEQVFEKQKEGKNRIIRQIKGRWQGAAGVKLLFEFECACRATAGYSLKTDGNERQQNCAM
jgi:hypothetical protein